MIKTTIYEKVAVRDENHNILGFMVRTKRFSASTLAQRAKAVMQAHLDQKAERAKPV